MSSASVGKNIIIAPIQFPSLSQKRVDSEAWCQMASAFPPATSLPLQSKRRKPPPVSISTKPSDVDPLHLRELMLSSGLSCHRFPSLSPDGSPLPVDLPKLRLALSRSSILVSAFCSSSSLAPEDPPAFRFFEGVVPIPAAERRLVGFGRAVSDGGLTASIHDVVVIPSLRRLGIGRKIVQKMIRLLTSKEIYDISALCSETESLFFKACGFGNDLLGSTTMMYTRSASSDQEKGPTLHHAARKLLLVPPLPVLGAYLPKRSSDRTVDLLDADNPI